MSKLPDLRPDLAAIAGTIPDGARVLDIGCGPGTLLAALAEHKRVDARGLEIDPERVATCVARGLSVVQGDAEADLVHYPDDAFDYAILGQTIQMVDRPAEVIDELLRVGRAAFISFPNFAHWRMRVALGLGGRMPVTPALPEAWHATGNIRNLTVVDFKDLVADRGARVERAWYFGKGHEIGEFGANLRAEFALFLIGRG
ncbi:methionine biosynthesis protein MetW [Citromicrobium bathyomarinum]|uniref:methionine biosynthesis protein MetW n=1 Tax=Citromicrobium bathyomarinum TaxID=72174 RepID=UPI00315A40E1